MVPDCFFQDSLDAFPFSPNESFDDETFEALMGLNDDDFPVPLPDGIDTPDRSPPRPNPDDPNVGETLQVAEIEMEEKAAEEGAAASPSPPVPVVSGDVELMDERIAYLQLHDRNWSISFKCLQTKLDIILLGLHQVTNKCLGTDLRDFPWCLHLARPSLFTQDTFLV